MATQTLNFRKIKFKGRDQSTFFSVLRRRIYDYLEQKPNKGFADTRMYIKIVFWLSTWLLSYLGIILGGLTGWALLGMAVFHGLTHIFIAFNISHDANHNSISQKPWVNKALSLSLDLIGVNSWLWRLLHNQIHHSYVNVDGVDTNIEGFGIFRFSSQTVIKPHHKYQYLYWPIFYGLSTLNYVLLKDFSYIRGLIKSKDTRFKTNDLLILIVSKVFYFGYVLVLPILILDVPWYAILITYFCAHILMGIILALIFQMGHLTEGVHYPEIMNENTIEQDWAIHVVETTGDYAGRNPIVNWLFGGINTHLIHHLIPKICHTHYPELVPIVRETVNEYGMEYREIDGLFPAIGSHVRLLKSLGN